MEDALHLTPVASQVETLLAGREPEVLVLVQDAQDRWKGLHDRLIAIIAACIDDAVDNGAELAPLLNRIHERTSVGVDQLVSATPSAGSVAALLRTHNSTGSVTRDADVVVFEHECGSGLVHWRNNPGVTKVREGEVPGVPAGVPRYCARCMNTIAAVGKGSWRVTPPTSPDGRCRWELDSPRT